VPLVYAAVVSKTDSMSVRVKTGHVGSIQMQPNVRYSENEINTSRSEMGNKNNGRKEQIKVVVGGEKTKRSCEMKNQ